MEIIDNFLPEDQFRVLQRIVLSTYFPWNYIGRQSYTTTKDSFQFYHNFYRICPDDEKTGDSPSEYFAIIEPCLQKLGGTLLRAKVVLTPKTENPEFRRPSGFHSDYPNLTTATYYLNTNDGYTEFKDGKKVKSVENRILIFDSNLEHQGVTCTDEKIRVVINFNIR